MKRYLFQRILFSIFALMVVTGTVMFMTYALMDRSMIFTQDQVYNKLAKNEKQYYKHSRYEVYGYETMENYSEYIVSYYQEKYGEGYEDRDDFIAAKNALMNPETVNDNPDVQAFKAKYGNAGYTVEYYEPIYKFKKLDSSPFLIAYKDVNVFERFGRYLGNFFKIETIWDVQDENLTDRYVRWEWDERSNMPALVGSGTTHKYLLYFDDKFPFVHQNIFHIRLGASNVARQGIDTMDILKEYTGQDQKSEQEYPVDIGTGVTHSTAIDFHTVTYSPTVSSFDAKIFGEGEHYVNYTYNKDGLIRVGNSFVIGLFSVILAYLLGLPIGIWMARRKDKLVDKLGNAYIIFIMAVPSLAYIFVFAAIGTSIGFPGKWGNAAAWGPGNIWIWMFLPMISLALPSVGGLMKWVRRYMIDQSNADYVKFARSTGMTEGEIFRKHISRNAFIYIVHGVPANILGSLTGALITERVYAVEGVGGLLTNAINQYDNGVIIAGTVFYSALSIISLILGDLLLAKYDPRVSFSNERG